MTNSISIAFACDEGYSKHVAVVMHSILVNAATEDRHEFHILTMNIGSEAENRLREIATHGKATIFVHRVDANRLIGFPVLSHPLEAYLRLLLPEILPDREKILYLDADLLVLGSLSNLWDFPIEQKAVAAAIDSMTIFKGSALEHFKALQLPAEHLYFNTGVLLLNLKVLREIKLLETVKEWAAEHSDLMIHSDQDVLNVILAGNISYFHLRWNLQVPLIAPIKLGWQCTQEHITAVSDPAIIHYVTYRKPWRKEFKLPYQNLYFKYLAQTPWKDEAPQPLTFDLAWNRFIEELDWSTKWIKSKLRSLIGRNFKLAEDNKKINCS